MKDLPDFEFCHEHGNWAYYCQDEPHLPNPPAHAFEFEDEAQEIEPEPWTCPFGVEWCYAGYGVSPCVDCIAPAFTEDRRERYQIVQTSHGEIVEPDPE